MNIKHLLLLQTVHRTQKKDNIYDKENKHFLNICKWFDYMNLFSNLSIHFINKK